MTPSLLDASVPWADAVFDTANTWVRFTPPEELAAAGRKVCQFAVSCTPAVDDLDRLVSVLPPRTDAERATLEILRTGQAPVQVEQWMLRAGRARYRGLVVLTFANRLRVAVVSGPYDKPAASTSPAVRAATGLHLRDTKRVPVLRFAPDPAPSTMKEERRQQRADEWVTGLLQQMLGPWMRAARAVLARQAARDAAAASQRRVEQVLDQWSEVFASRGLCVFPLSEMGWYYSGRVEELASSSRWNDDGGWSLPPAPALGHPDVTCIRGWLQMAYADGTTAEDSFEDCRDPGQAMSLCGAPTPGGSASVCALHEALPYRSGMTADAWEHAAAAVEARRAALFHVEAAWASTVPDEDGP